MAHDVFISYPGKDKTVADAVCAKLEAQKIRCWIAPRDIPAGKNFAESIIDAIDASKVFVLIWSINTNTSTHILNEINQAFNQGIPIIPFRIEEVEPTSAMRYYFGRTHWLDALTPPLEKHIDILVNSVLSNLDRNPAEIPAPVKVEVEPETKKPRNRESETPAPVISYGQPKPEKKKKKTGTPAVGTMQSNRKKKLAIIIPLILVALAVISLVIMYMSGLFQGFPLTEKPGTSTPTATVSPTITITAPTPTITPTALPVWIQQVNLWADPILAAIENQTPDFEDVFSKLDAEWVTSFDTRYCPDFDPASSFMVHNGKLQLEIDSSCTFFSFTHPMLTSINGNFILQTEIIFPNASKNYEISVRDENRGFIDFMLSHNGWVLFVPVPGTEEDWQTLHEENFPEELQAPVTLTVLMDGTRVLFYVDSNLLLSYSIPGGAIGDKHIDLIVTNGGNQDVGSEPLTLDNIRFWDLDNLFIPERILAQVENETPAFADDFSQVDPAWQFVEDPSGEFNPENANIDISDGSMKCVMQNVWGGVLSYPDMQYKNYVLQIDVDFNNHPISIEPRSWPIEPDGVFPNFALRSPEGDWTFEMNAGEPSVKRYEGKLALDYRPDFSKPVRLTIINKSPFYLVYLDTDLLVSSSSQVGEGPFLFDFIITTGGNPVTEQLTVELDNIKIWNLDN